MQQNKNNRWRVDFPILNQKVNGHPLVYLDNAATTQKPQSVIDALVYYYQHDNSNVHRGAHQLADRATTAFEKSRTTVQKFIGAQSSDEILWTKGTTESINMVAQSYLLPRLKPGDKVIVSELEHHANFVPWQQICLQKSAELVVIPLLDSGELDLEFFYRQLDESVIMVSIAHVSNAVGTVHPIKKVIDLSHKVGAKVLIDGAQAVAHMPIDVVQLNCDFYAFSGHKLFAPTGIGVLYGKSELLNEMDVYQMGGEMIADVSLEKTTFNAIPYKFEAGTPNIAGVIGLGAAIDYLNQTNISERVSYEDELLAYIIQQSQSISVLKRVGTSSHQTGVFSFVLDGMHNQDVGTILDQQGVAIRTGHHCAMPSMKKLGLINGSMRASISFYNTFEDIDRFFAAVHKAIKFLS